MKNIKDVKKRVIKKKERNKKAAIRMVAVILASLVVGFIATTLIYYFSVDLYVYYDDKTQISFSHLTGLDETNVSEYDFSKESNTEKFSEDEAKNFAKIMSKSTYTELSLLKAFPKIFIDLHGTKNIICNFLAFSDDYGYYYLYYSFGKIYLLCFESYLSDGYKNSMTLYVADNLSYDDIDDFRADAVDYIYSDDAMYEGLYYDSYSIDDILFLWYSHGEWIFLGTSFAAFVLIQTGRFIIKKSKAKN